jgi:hypothetical protein
VLLGDIALGPMPAETLDLLASFGDRVVWVHGNCEREVVSAYDGVLVAGPNGESARDCAALNGAREYVPEPAGDAEEFEVFRALVDAEPA